MSRTEVVQIRVTPELLAEIEREVQKTPHLTVSTWGATLFEVALARGRKKKARR